MLPLQSFHKFEVKIILRRNGSSADQISEEKKSNILRYTAKRKCLIFIFRYCHNR